MDTPAAISERVDPVVTYAEIQAARRGGASDAEAAERVGPDVLVQALESLVEQRIAVDPHLAQRFAVLVRNAVERSRQLALSMSPPDS